MLGLPLLQRLSLAYKALTSQFDTGRAQLAQQMLAGIFPSTNGPAPARNAIQLLNTFNDSPWIRACAGRVADAKAATNWKLYRVAKNGRTATARDIDYIQKAPDGPRACMLKELRAAGELTEITDHIMLTALRSGSSALTGWDTRWLQSLYLDLNGECFLLIQRNQVGAPIKFWIVPPHWVAETPTPKRPAYRLQWQAFQADVPDREMLWLKQPNALEPYQRGVGIAKSLDDDLATDEYAAKHCHDDRTECLTRRGWVNGLDLTMDDEVATWNHECGMIEYHRPLQITNVPYSGVMHYWLGENVDALITPTHRLWVEQKETPGKGKRRTEQAMTWKFAQSREVAAKPGRILHWRSTGWYNGLEGSLTIPACERITKRASGSRGGGRPPMFGVNEVWTVKAFDFARFLGYYISEGSVGRAALSLSQTEDNYAEDLRRSLDVFPSQWVREESAVWKGKRRYRWHVRHHGLAEWVRRECGIGSYQKRIPDCAFEWPHSAQNELLTGLMNGDGQRTETSGRYGTRSQRLASDVQRLCVNLGYASTIRVRVDRRGVPYYLVSIGYTRTKERLGKQAAWYSEQYYDGRVWCVTVQNERFVSRRNGRVMIGGNTLKFFKNSARPDLLVMPKEGQFDKAERDRFEEWWNEKLQGFWRSFKPLFLHTPVEVKLLEQNFRNMQLTELRKHERDTIMQVWGIPPEMFGVVSSSNRSTIEIAPYIFSKYCVVPRIERERSFYQERLVPEYDDRLLLDYASPVPEDKEFRLKVMSAQPSAFEKNEFRELAGLEELDDLDGDFAGEATVAGQPGAPGDDETGDEAGGNLEDLDDEEAAALYLINRKLIKR